MKDKILQLLYKIEYWETIQGIRNGLTVMIPIFMIGSAMLLIVNTKLLGLQDFFQRTMGVAWENISGSLYRGTFEIMAVIALITVTYFYAIKKELVIKGEVDVIAIIVTVVASFSAYNYDLNNAISLKNTGSTSLLKSIIIAIIATNSFLFFYKVTKKGMKMWGKSIYRSNVVRISLHAILPALLTIGILTVASEIVNTYVIETLQIFENDLISHHSLGSYLFLMLLALMLWVLGIHGTNVIYSFNMMELSGKSSLGYYVKNSNIFTQSFIDTFIFIGGAGATLGLIIALLLVQKKSAEKTIAKISTLFSLFNANEILVYGLPIVFNPYYIIPFIITPFVLVITSYLAFSLQLVSPQITEVSWVMPIFISGYKATGSISGAILQAVNLLISVLIYFPFVKLQYANQKKNEQHNYKKLLYEIVLKTSFSNSTVLNKENEVGKVARSLVTDLTECLEGKNELLHLEYQPKVNTEGQIVGAEALLRCQHPVVGSISPMVILTLCKEAELVNKLGTWVIQRAFMDIKKIHELTQNEICISINLDPGQLRNDDRLLINVKNALEETGINPCTVDFEITENSELELNEQIFEKIKILKALGVKLSIDDFSMGHSSLTYLNQGFADTVKMDISLVKGINHDKQLQYIASALIELCSRLKVTVIAEGVETKEEFQTLSNMNCLNFQGYYFSKSLKMEEFIKKVNTCSNK